MKKIVLIIMVLAGAFKSVAQNNVYGKKVVGLDSLVSDVITNENAGSLSIEQITADGSDNGVVYISGGGTYSNSRGSFIKLEGNEASSGGEIEFRLGNVTGSEIFFYDRYGTVGTSFNGSSADWDFNTNSLTDIGSLTVDNLTLDGNDITSTSELGINTAGSVDVNIGGSSKFLFDVSDEDFVVGGSARYGEFDFTAPVNYSINTGSNLTLNSDNLYLDYNDDNDGSDLFIRSNNSNVVSINSTGNATFSGNVTTGGTITLDREGDASPATLVIVSDDAERKQIQFKNEGNSRRWNVGSTASSDADFFIEAFNNANVSQGNYFEIDRGTGNATFSGDVSITGSLSKGSGTFKITHPLDTSKWLYHSFVEAPRADNIYRGQVELYRGIARVRIDTASNMMEGTFDALNQNVQVFVTNNDTWDRVRGYYSNGIIYIECQNELSRAVVDWLVIGERKDQTVIDWNLTDENGQLIPEWNKQDEN
jgi:lipopolysaccharide export system protein LptA